jgi:hypothetical protein
MRWEIRMKCLEKKPHTPSYFMCHLYMYENKIAEHVIKVNTCMHIYYIRCISHNTGEKIEQD